MTPATYHGLQESIEGVTNPTSVVYGRNIRSKTVTKYKVEVQADSSGAWAGNGLLFETELEAKSYAIDLAGRWTSVREWRVIPAEEQTP